MLPLRLRLKLRYIPEESCREEIARSHDLVVLHLVAVLVHQAQQELHGQVVEADKVGGGHARNLKADEVRVHHRGRVEGEVEAVLPGVVGDELLEVVILGRDDRETAARLHRLGGRS